MPYIDEFAVAVPNSNKEAYIAHAKLAGDIFKEYGALKLIEAWGDDVPDGENPMPFDGKRLIYSGFETILEL